MADDFLERWEAFRADREARLRSPHGFLSITALHWLDGTPRRYAGAPGAWWAGTDGVEVDVGPDEPLTVDGRQLRGHHLLGPMDEDGIRAHAGDVEIEVARREAGVLLRPRDPARVRRAGLRATPTFPPSPDWVVRGTFHTGGGDATVDDVVGEVTLAIADEPVRLAAYDDNGGLWLVFTDATSGRTTYPAGRQLYTAAPAPDGTVVLDFNRTINLPCAYTEFTTCPVPPPQNRLRVAVEAGEQLPLVATAQE